MLNKFRHQGQPSPFDDIRLPRISVTPHGIKLQLPLIETHGAAIAVLLCERVRGGHLGLVLTHDPSWKDPTTPRFYVGCIYNKGSILHDFAVRVVILGDDWNCMQLQGEPIKAKWRTFYVVPTPPDSTSSHTTIARLPTSASERFHVRLPHWLRSRLQGTCVGACVGGRRKSTKDNGRERRVLGA